MKDLHSHLLPGIDDGSKSFEESITLLKKLEKAGVTELILTPHYVENSKYTCNNREKEQLFKEIVTKIKEENINVRVYLGNEVFFTTKMVDLIKKGQVRTLNKSKYILFEFPMNQIYNNSFEIISSLAKEGYIPVLAHPERYLAFQRHPEMIEEYIRAGVLLQGNYTSLFCKYGKNAKKTLVYFLKKKWISFLGGDVHHDVKFTEKKLLKLLHKCTKDEEYIELITNKNFDNVIQNKPIGMRR